jgi:hypothetical protein
MTKVLIAIYMGAAVAAAQEAKVTPLRTQELEGMPGTLGRGAPVGTRKRRS